MSDRTRGALDVRAAGELAAIACALACGGFPGVAGAPHGAAGARQDAVTVGDHGSIAALSAGRRMLFAGSAGGLAIRDELADRWLPPLGEADGFPASRLTLLSADPELDAVWIGALGEVVFYHPALDQLTRVIVPGRVERIVFDRDAPSAGAYVASGGTWTRVTHAGVAFPVRFDEVPPSGRQWTAPDLSELTRRHPSLQSFAGLLTRDDALRSWRITSGTRIGDRSEVWLGTDGGGLYHVDPLFNRARHVPYGLFERGASALAAGASGVWIGSEARDFGATGGVAAADLELQRWVWLRGPADRSMSGARVNDLLIDAEHLWAGTSRGLARWVIAGPTLAEGAAGAAVAGAPAGGEPSWVWLAASPAERVWALARTAEGVWAGTDAGLVFVADGAAAPGRASPGPAVRALARTGDTLWAGTDFGLRVLHAATQAGDPGPAVLEPPVLAPTTNLLDRRIRALARGEGVLAVATDDAVVLIDLVARSAHPLPPSADARPVAPITSLAVDGDAIWVGGERGLLVVDRVNGASRVVPLPLPPGSPVHDVVIAGGYVWLATVDGVVRLRRSRAG